MAITDGGPVAPAWMKTVADREDSKGRVRVITSSPVGGLTVRDYFAGQAISGGFRRMAGVDWHAHADVLARQAYIIADAMLAARQE